MIKISSEESIKMKVIEALYRSKDLKSDGIKIATRRGELTLEGYVPSQREKVKAEQIAREASNGFTVINSITVDLDMPSPRRKVQEIAGALIKSGIDASDVKFSIENGTVTLKGCVMEYREKLSAEEALAGTFHVVNLLRITPTKDENDKILSEKALNAIQRKINVDLNRLDIKVFEGQVSLTGEVPNHIVKDELTDLIRNLSGVTKLSNHLRTER